MCRGRNIDNPLSRANDFRTNLDDPTGPQDRAPNVKCSEVTRHGKPYFVFYTIDYVAPGKEILWDYGSSYWLARKQRIEGTVGDITASNQTAQIEAYEAEENDKIFYHNTMSEAVLVAGGMSVWGGCMWMDQQAAGALVMCLVAAAYYTLVASKWR